MPVIPTTVDFPAPVHARRHGGDWWVESDGADVRIRNVEKLFWAPEGYTKGDLVTYYANIAPTILPYLRDRPLTLKRMPEGADGAHFYAKQAPNHTPGWVATAPVVSRDSGKTVDYLLAQDRATLLWLANLGCIEMHVWHGQVGAIGCPDYAFFDLDPFEVDFAVVRDVALLVKTVLDGLGLRGYPRTSGATGMQVMVPIEPRYTADQVREWVGRACRLINRADPERTTMEWEIAKRTGKVFLDHNMNTEGKNIVSAWSVRPERAAPVATPVTWEEVAADIVPTDFTIATIWQRLETVGDLGTPVLERGQDLHAAMAALGMDPDADEGRIGHEVRLPPPAERLQRYAGMRDFTVTPEPGPAPPDDDEGARPVPGVGDRFVLQHHLATRLHHDLRFERHGTAPSWALPKGLPDVPGVKHLAVQTEDHPVSYMTFEGEIPAGEYGAGPVRIWDSGTYEALEWRDGKVTFRLSGQRHRGEWHLFRVGGAQDPSEWMVVRADEPAPGELPPPPPAMAPMLATDGGEPFDDADWLFEVKWDGIRAVATCVRPGAGAPGSTTLTSRLGNDITGAYPELAALWERVLARNAVLDGEIVAFDRNGVPSFQRLQQRMHVRDARQAERLRERIPVVYMVFDVLAVDGAPLVDLPLTERAARLDELLVPSAAVQRSSAIPRDGCALFAAAVERGLEGVVAKRAASPYRPGRRTRDWRKLKVRRSADVVIGGWLPGEGARSALGSLYIGLYHDGALHCVGKVGSGLDDAAVEHLRARFADLGTDDSPFAEAPRDRAARWVRPDLVCAVDYAEVTDGGHLRAPSYKGLRRDVDPRACVLEDVTRRPAGAPGDG
jgi:bifunctional non-homologous end joining protein LigD